MFQVQVSACGMFKKGNIKCIGVGGGGGNSDNSDDS